jgi:putative DNA primase/helicase
MDRKGHEMERNLWLKGWAGLDSHEIATIGRGRKYLPTLCLSVIGSTQPGKWRSYIRSVLGEGSGNDGLVQRLQLCVWPDDVVGGYTDIPRDAQIAAQVEARLRAMVAMGGDTGPVVFKFTPDAQEVFIAWYNRLEAKRRSSEHTEAVLSHFSKYKGFMPSLALIFELFDDVPGLFDTSPAAAGFQMPEAVSAKNATRAVHFLKWLSLHVARTYGCLDDTFRAGALGERIKGGELGASFTFNDVRRKGWKGLKTKEDVQAALGALTDALWVRYNPSKRRYSVNPRIEPALPKAA